MSPLANTARPPSAAARAKGPEPALLWRALLPAALASASTPPRVGQSKVTGESPGPVDASVCPPIDRMPAPFAAIVVRSFARAMRDLVLYRVGTPSIQSENSRTEEVPMLRQRPIVYLGLLARHVHGGCGCP